MTKVSFQRLTTRRILEAAPNLKYIAFYHSSEDRLNACMQDYANRSFVYVLTAMYKEAECFLYVGKSRAQYSRHLMHAKKYAYDHIYLFECEPEYLTQSEAAVIKELTPLFNRAGNPQAKRIKLLLNINYDAKQDAQMIQQYLEKYFKYAKVGLFGFALPAAIFVALEEEATRKGINCSEMLQDILENALGERIVAKLDADCDIDTNLTSAKSFGVQNKKSTEQIKQYLHQGDRILGAIRLGRDWILPRDAQFPEDLRGKRRG